MQSASWMAPGWVQGVGSQFGSRGSGADILRSRQSTPAPGPLTPSTVDQLAAISGLMTGAQQTQIEAEGRVEASALSQRGAAAEREAYQTAKLITEENARIAGLAGEIAVFQQQREVASKIGDAEAAWSGAGALGGNIYDIMRSSYQQGAIGTQLINVQTALDVSGHLASAAALEAQAVGANAQEEAAAREAAAYSAQATQAAQQVQNLQNTYSTEIDRIESLADDPAQAAEPARPSVRSLPALGGTSVGSVGGFTR